MKVRSCNFCYTNSKNPENNLGIFCLIIGRPKLNGYIKAATQPPKSSLPNRLQIRFLLSISSCLYELIAYATHIDDAQPRVVPQAMAQLGDEHLQAAAIEERVVAPKCHEDVMRFDHVGLLSEGCVSTSLLKS